MYQVGDKFIIEIGGICPECASDADDDKLNTNLYRIKGFNSLVFDEFGLNKLVPLNSDAIKYYAGFNKELNDEAYQRGLNDAWEAARKIIAWFEYVPNQSILDRFNIDGTWGECVLGVLFNNQTVEHAISKIREYEEKKEYADEIQVGDEVIHGNGEGAVVGVVTRKSGTLATIVMQNGSSNEFDLSLNNFKLTGQHFPQIVEVLRRMETERK